MDYTAAQRDAIAIIDQNLQIIACAGSGKTQVIAARIAHILQQEGPAGIRPAHIVAFTFTERAAAELKDRVHRLCGETPGVGTQGLAEMYIGTIHGYCLQLLQAPPLYRYLKYSVLTDVQQRLFIDRHPAASGLNSLSYRPASGEVRPLKRWANSRLYMSLLGVLGEAEPGSAPMPAAVQEALEKYYGLLERKSQLDYTTMVANAVAEIQGHPGLRATLGEQLRYLVVDEYQDVNPLQEMLIREMHDLGANLCVVGDDDQTIYQWRGSDVGNILTFAARYPDVRQVRLDENFRSSEGIVTAARQVVERNPARLAKEMRSTAAQPYAHGDILAREFETAGEEAAWIAGKIAGLRGTPYQDKPEAEPRGLTYGDCAILLRTVTGDGDPILAVLRGASIPVAIVGMHNLFDVPEVQAMRAVFYYLAGYTAQDGATTVEGLRALLGSSLGLRGAGLEAGLAFLSATRARITNRIDAELFLQRVYLGFLGACGLTEEGVGGAAGRPGELVYYNLGKFSQVISDFEHINLNTTADRLYSEFAGFLEYQAPGYYPEGGEDAAAIRPDAVQVMTVHQAKGMQWPVVFVPALRAGTFPSTNRGGATVWGIIPRACVAGAERYDGTEEDERRLFYVALTRAERFLFCSWAPRATSRRARRSPFFGELTADIHVLGREPTRPAAAPLPPRPRKAEVALALTFSQLKYYFQCPYQFKLRFLYGFDTPIDRALGYGKSLHDALAHIHAEAIRGRIPDVGEVPGLVEDHLHMPFANAEVLENAREAARASLTRYLRDNGAVLRRLEHVEKVIELKLAEGIVVHGRIDLIRRTDTGEVIIVDFKSKERAQAEELTAKQLQIYAVGYEQLTGRMADMIEVRNLDDGNTHRELVDTGLIEATLGSVLEAGRQMRANRLVRLPVWGRTCEACDHAGICRTRPTLAAVH